MADQASTSELKLYTENDVDIYRRTTTPIVRNLRTKQAQGKYDHEMAVQAFMYLAESGARKYAREYGGGEHEWHLIFPIDVRRQAAAEWRDEFETESSLGNYDNATYLPKKYLAKTKKTTKHTTISRTVTTDGRNRHYCVTTGDAVVDADCAYVDVLDAIRQAERNGVAQRDGEGYAVYVATPTNFTGRPEVYRI